jgi:hypothetical protein
MRIPVIRHGQIAALAYGIGLAVAFLAATPGQSFALTVQSPEVLASVAKAIKFLETAPEDNRMGAKALLGLSLMTVPVDPEHPQSPKIAEAANTIHKALGTLDAAKLEAGVWDIYSTGLAIIFLVEFDKEKYRPDIECLLAYLHKRQKPHGGWGYPERETGDTSMTQYGVLSSWVAIKEGKFAIPIESIEAVANWLMRTQDPNGAFGYQGNIAPAGGALVPQSEIHSAMAAAGSGSLYICADILELIEVKEQRKNVPVGMKEVKKKDPAKSKPKTKIPLQSIRETQNRAKQWLDTNGKIEPGTWPNYYLYALERCMSFRAFFEQKDEEKEPKWYNEGAEYLFKSQAENGSWNGQCGTVPDTAFAILFLTRSTKRKIVQAHFYETGTMVCGRGIPKDTGMIKVDSRGQLVAKPMSDYAEQVIRALEQPGGQDFDKSMDLLAELPGDKAESLAAKYGDRIRELVGNKSPAARLAAVKALSKIRDLDNVETLIYALTDPDPQVVHAANDGLLRIRRIPLGFVLPDSFSEDDRRLLVEKWKAWYQSIRPGVEMR